MKDHFFLRDRSIKELIENCNSNWTTDKKLSYEEIGNCCAIRKLDIDVDSALHVVIAAILDRV